RRSPPGRAASAVQIAGPGHELARAAALRGEFVVLEALVAVRGVGSRFALCGRVWCRRRGVPARSEGVLARQPQLQVDVAQGPNFSERRQLIEALQAEIVEELARRAEQLRVAGHIAVTDDAHPVA